MVVACSGDRRYGGEVTSEENVLVGVLAVQDDVSHNADVKQLFSESIAHFNRVDVLVNNAGIMHLALVKDTTEEMFQRTLDVNVKGVFNTLREAATQLADGGRVINLSSSATRLMMPTYAAYCASKGAVEQFKRVFAKEIAPRNITVNTVSPGPVNTELFNKGKSPELLERIASQSAFNRIGEPQDITGIVLFLASDQSQWISGQNLGANGGYA